MKDAPASSRTPSRQSGSFPLFLLAAFSLLSGTPSPALADTATVNGQTWTYTVSNGKATVTGGPSSGDIVIPSMLGGCPVASIGEEAFYRCTGLSSVVIPDSVAKLGDSSFWGCSGLTSVDLPEGVTHIGNHAFHECRGILNVSIPASVAFIGDSAFWFCSSLQSFDVAVDNPSFSSRDGVVFSKNGETLVVCPGARVGSYEIPNGVTTIRNTAFFDCGKLTSVTIPKGVTHIGDSTFMWCGNLVSVTIPAGVASIGDSAFYGCSSLSELTIPDGLTSIGPGAFWGCNSLTSVTIPDSVRTIGGWAFEGCGGLTSVAIPAGTTSIGDSPFAACGRLLSIDVAADNPLYTSRDGVLYSKDGLSLLSFPGGRSGAFTVPAGTTRIGPMAFRGSQLTSLTIPDGVTRIEQSAFIDCCNLASVALPDSVTYIGSLAFQSCYGLLSITLPGRLTWIGNQTFYGCNHLASVTIPDGVTDIGHLAFGYCSALTSLSIPDSVGSMENYVFYGCDGLKSIVVPGNWEGTTILSDASVPDDCEVEYRPITRISVAFEASGGICATDRATFKLGDAFGQLPTATRTGHSFGGWFTERDGQGTQVTAESLVEAGISTLYAKWTPQPYTVKFSPNGGTGTMDAQKMAYGSSAKLRKNAFTREGFVFLGWAKSKTGSVVYGDQANVKNLSSSGGSVTLYAQWAKKTYAVAFDANGGTLPKGKTMAPQKMAYGKAAALQANAFTRKGYVFYGWSRSKTGKREFANKAEVKNLRTDGKTQTLFAVWAKESYLVSFDANGGKGKMAAQKMMFGKASNLAKNAFTKKGWLFAGWAKSAELAKNGKVAYKNGASVKNLRTDGKTTTLYAVWEKAQTVKFDANGGTCAPAEKDFKVGKAYGSFPTPEWKWRTFLGWFTTADGGEWVAETDVAETTAARKLFAHWEYIPVRLGETSKTVGPDAAEKLSVALSAKADWTASADAAWIAVRTKSGASGSGSLVFDVAKNAGKARTGRVIVSAGGKAVVLTVSQKARTLTLSASKKVFKAKAATGQKLGVTATVAWTAKSSAKWLTVKKAKGTGNGTIVYELAANKGAGRAAKITVSGGGKKATFRVEQKGKDGSEPVAPIPAETHYLQIDPTRETFDADGTTNGIAVVNSDLAWTASATVDWIELDDETQSGSGGGLLRYRVEENGDGTNRTGKIAVAASGLKATLTIEQAAKERVLYLCVMPTNRTATAAAATDTVWVEANVAWTAGTDEDKWIELKNTTGNGNGSITYRMSDNTTGTNRTGTITVFGGGLVAKFTLKQEKATGTGESDPPPPPKFLRVNPTYREHNASAQTKTFQIESNVSWTLTRSDGWIVLTDPKSLSGSNYKTVQYSLSKYTGTGTRTGTITVRGSGVSPVTFTIIQHGVANPPSPHPPPPPPSPWIQISPEPPGIGVPAEGGRAYCLITTSSPDLKWTLSVSHVYGDWIHLDSTSGKGSAVVGFSVDPNAAKTKRRETLRVRSFGVGSDYTYVVQAGKEPLLQVSPTRFPKVSWKGATLSFNVIANVDWTATSNVEWIELGSPSSGTTATKQSWIVPFTVKKNETGVDRPGTITVSGGGIKRTIVVIQEKGTILRVSPNPITVSWEPGQYRLSVESNVKWSVTSKPGWIILIKSNGNGNGLIVFETKKNTTGKRRSGFVVVSGGGVTREVKVIQKANPVLEVTPTKMTVSYKEAKYALDVMSNVSWKAKTGSGWISILTTAGKGDGSISFKVSKNGTGKDRKGTIVVTGGGLKRTVVVIQKKAPILKISPAKNTVAPASASSWFYVTANMKWTAKSSASWLKVTKVHVDTSGTKNGGYVEYDVSANKTAKKRTATITVTGGGKSVVFTLTQKGRPNLCFHTPDNSAPAEVFNAYGNSQTQFVAGEYPSPVALFAIHNSGGSASGAFTIKIDLFVNGELSIPLRPSVKTLAADQVLVLPISVYRTSYEYNKMYMYAGSEIKEGYTPLTTGTYTIRVTLDSSNSVPESDETDNVYSVSFYIISDGYASSCAECVPSSEWSCEPDRAPSAEAPDYGDSVDLIGAASEAMVSVVASGGEDAGAVADGDEETSWTPDAADGAWCVLTFPEPVDATNAELVGDGLPEGTRLLFSEDSENWREDLPARVQYVWAVFPASDEPFAVREIRLLSK